MNNTFKFAIFSVVLVVLSISATDKALAASSHVKVSDIVGSSENGADDKLYKRGFLLVDGNDSGGESFKTYYNGKSKQCVMLEIMDNKVISVNPTQSPKCGKANSTAKPASSASANVKVSDIVGSTENGADDKFYKRGFTLVDGQSSGEESFKTYYNNKSHQCVMAEIMDNKVISINPSKSDSCH